VDQEDRYKQNISCVTLDHTETNGKFVCVWCYWKGGGVEVLAWYWS